MATYEEAQIPVVQHDELRQTVFARLNSGKQFWRPMHARMDYWMMMYRLQDVVQATKPVGMRRFVSNEPHTAVDLALSILTRNDSFWRIALFEATSENMDERQIIGKIERVLQGFVYDIDEMMGMRLRMPFWKQVAASALLRGYIWGKVHITTEALKYRDTPLMAEVYDPRMVYPHVDAFGLNYVIIESQTTVGDLVNQYPETWGDREKVANFNPNAPAVKLEYWSNDRGARKGINGVLAAQVPVEQSYVYDISAMGAVSGMASDWVVKPYEHGYTPDALPIVGVPVNGLNLQVMPQLGEMFTDRLAERQAYYGTPTSYNWWTGGNAFIAESGRSILAAVEEHVPQYNELIATIMQHLGMTTYPTMIFKTPTGELPRFQGGIGAQIPLTPEESVQALEFQPISSDAYKLVELLGDEKQNGMIANILRSNSNFSGNGVTFQQQANSALNALEPYQAGLEEFGQRIGTSILAQLQMAKGIIKPFQLMAPHAAGASKRQSYWLVDFDPKKDLGKQKRYRPRPVFRPALPDDLAVRINSARLALDPRRPILSLTTVLENILQLEDPNDEIDRIWEDIANTDPVIVLEQVGAALERLGEHEFAQRIQEKQFQTNFIQEMQFKQQTGQDIPQPGMAPDGSAPGQLPSSAGGGPSNTTPMSDAQGQGATPADAGGGGLPNGMPTGV